MIARPAVRFERAGLFFCMRIENGVGDGFGNIEAVARRVWDRECFGWNRCGAVVLKSVQTSFDPIDRGEQRSEVGGASFGLDQLGDLIGETRLRIIFHCSALF